MLDAADIIPADGVLLHLKAADVASAIEQISAVAAEITGQRAPIIREALLARMRQGVSLGEGVLIPHARLEGLRRIVGFFARPLLPITDEHGNRITMMFVLLAPEGANAEHLKMLAHVAGILRDGASRDILLHGERDAIYALLTRA